MVRQRTAALNNERRFLRTLINTLPDMVWLKDKDGAYRLCNAKVEAYLVRPRPISSAKRMTSSFQLNWRIASERRTTKPWMLEVLSRIKINSVI